MARDTGGRLVGPDVVIDGVSFDSRAIVPGQLFVPIVDRRDGHDFIESALVDGAAAYLTAGPARGGTAVVVDDTLAALMRLAAARRDRSTATVVGITESVGKTSTKDLVRDALAPSRRTHANERSFNNDQGLPTTVLNAPDDTEVLVVEMGMRGAGEIARLCEIARPSIGVVTRVAEAHSDRLGGIDGVARAKRELVESLPVDGTAILNADDPRVLAMAGHTSAAVLRYGEQEGCDVHVTSVVLDHLARPAFAAHTPWGEVFVRLGVSGRHMVANAAAALAVVGAVGADLDAAVAAMADTRLTAMRMDVMMLRSGARIIDDSYNANPTSMRAALDALAALPAVRRRAVLGVMAEISEPEREHRAIHAYAAQRGVEVLAVGTDLYGVTGLPDPAAAVEALGRLGEDDAVLVKGSRVAGLERVVESLV
ncbi:MAG: UDP-N-acetylmuramoyl-tripeptide--D-alanyl-D-alanine ligase [Ilumatobacteraceae bacterium]